MDLANSKDVPVSNSRVWGIPRRSQVISDAEDYVSGVASGAAEYLWIAPQESPLIFGKSIMSLREVCPLKEQAFGIRR